jgi:hypothetical protein
MKRTPFRFKAPVRPEATQSTYTARPRAVALRVTDTRARLTLSLPRPKEGALQHLGYMALVRGLPCARCGFDRRGYVQFCHADILGVGGKGLAMKSDCRLGWPGCGPHGGVMGCHWTVGTSGALLKAERHAFELRAGAATRAAILKAGLWPARLPLWTET